MNEQSETNDNQNINFPKIDLHLNEPAWPDQNRFPHNRTKKEGSVQKVERIVEKDLRGAQNILIITGYTSLSQVIKFLADSHKRNDPKESIRVLIGHDPNLEKRKSLKNRRRCR